MLLDIHVHSRYSEGDAYGSPEELVRSAKKWGLDAIAITDHHTCAGVPEALAAGEKLGILVIPGAEIIARERGRDMHVIALGLNQPSLPPPQPLAETVAWIRKQGGIATAAHPFWAFGAGKRAALCDAIECHNSTGDRLMDFRAEVVAARMGLPRVAGSDAHSPDMVGLGRTWVDCDGTLEGTLDAIRAGRTRIVKRSFFPIWRFYQWVDEHSPPQHRARRKLFLTLAYASTVVRNLPGCIIDSGACFLNGRTLPPGLPWHLPE